jgi:hypothetical protein
MPESAEILRDAWDELIARLQQARDAIDSPDLHAPPSTDRVLAEGYRYLLGFTFGAIERAMFEDPDFPSFRRAIQPTDKATIDNADAIYLSAVLDGRGTYRLRGTVADTSHWRGGAPVAGTRAPQYVIIETHKGYAGDTGNLMELSPAVRAITGSLDSAEITVTDGTFDILLAPERPDGYEGDFIQTVRTGADGTEHVAGYLILRCLYGDWEHEVAPELHLARVGHEGRHPAPLTAEDAAARMRRLGDLVDNQMRFWNEFYDLILEAHGDRNGDGQTFMPRNDLNAPAFANLATGGGQATNVYAGGMFDLGPDEALLIETSVPVPPAYTGFHLANLWGESLDYANHVTSLNGQQAVTDPDGVTRIVVAHTDPGVPNWVDTTGIPDGFMTFRWTYSEKTEQLPTVTVQVVDVAKVAALLPEGTPRVSPEERREQVRIRQEHVQRRYRQY